MFFRGKAVSDGQPVTFPWIFLFSFVASRNYMKWLYRIERHWLIIHHYNCILQLFNVCIQNICTHSRRTRAFPKLDDTKIWKWKTSDETHQVVVQQIHLPVIFVYQRKISYTHTCMAADDGALLAEKSLENERKWEHNRRSPIPWSVSIFI